MRRYLGLSAFAIAFIAACGGSGNGEPTEDGGVVDGCAHESTFAAIQSEIFDARGCTNAACHGQPAETAPAGLDLREGFAYESLIRVQGEAGDMPLVFPGDQDLSLLYLKLAAKTFADDPELAVDLAELGISGDPMPFTGDAVSADELTVLRAWIRGGALENTIVKGTEDVLGCSEPVVADPNKIAPLPVPPPQTGVQFYSGAYTLPKLSEDEQCFVSYYDYSSQVPASARLACPENFGTDVECFSFGRNELAQDGQSHHSIITVYTPPVAPSDPAWGDWSCLGGENNGSACDPTNIGGCGARSQCTTQLTTSVACTGYEHAPADFGGFSLDGTSGTRIGLTGAQESTFVISPGQGVYEVMPVKGYIAWNSHAFNLTEKDTTIEQWVNVNFVHDTERRWLNQQIFDTSRIFGMNVDGGIQPYTQQEICMSFTLPRYARLSSMSSHTHQRGRLFRIWEPPVEPCEAGGFPTGLLSVDRNCLPEDREPMYLNRLYDDPLYYYFTPALALSFDSPDPVDRTFKACSVYDNGVEGAIYRHSTASQSKICDEGGIAAFASSCGCAGAKMCISSDVAMQGAPCDVDSDCGAGGECDACTVRGGLTTNDEMFVPLGSYYVETPGS